MSLIITTSWPSNSPAARLLIQPGKRYFLFPGVVMVEGTFTTQQFWAELDALGEEKVRERVAFGAYASGHNKKELAKEWLRQKDESRALSLESTEWESPARRPRRQSAQPTRRRARPRPPNSRLVSRDRRTHSGDRRPRHRRDLHGHRHAERSGSHASMRSSAATGDRRRVRRAWYGQAFGWRVCPL